MISRPEGGEADLSGSYQDLQPPPITPPPVANVSPSAAPVPKVWASSAGAGLGGAIGAILIWALQSAGLTVPPDVGVALATVCSMLVGFAAGYLTPPRSV